MGCRGRDARGNGTAAAKVTAILAEDGDVTRVAVHTRLDITGKPAQFGRGVMADVGNKLIGQFADNLAGDFAPQDGTDLKAAIARHEKASASLEDIATRADRIVTEIDEGKGSVGGLVKDDQLYKDLKALVADLKAHPWKVLWKQ